MVDHRLARIEAELVMPFDIGSAVICVRCRAVIHEPSMRETLCENCIENEDRLGSAGVAITAVSLYERESKLRTWITHYKPDIDDQHGELPLDAGECAESVALILNTFIARNGWLLDNADAVVVVPSTRRRPPHPLEAIIAPAIPDGLASVGGLIRTRETLDHRSASPNAYEVASGLRGQRVVLIDDVYASGARLQSAARAVELAGGQVANAVVVARRINPGYHDLIQQHWNDAKRRAFNWNRVQSSTATDLRR